MTSLLIYFVLVFKWRLTRCQGGKVLWHVLKKHDVKSVFLCTLTSCTKSLITKRCILSKSQTALHHRLPPTWALNSNVAPSARTFIFYLLESGGCSPTGDIIDRVQSPGDVGILSSRCSLVVDGWSEADGKERESSCLVCAESWLFSTRLCSYTKTTKMEDFYVSDHKIDMKIKIKYIYNTQVSWPFSFFPPSIFNGCGCVHEDLFSLPVTWAENNAERCS